MPKKCRLKKPIFLGIKAYRLRQKDFIKKLFYGTEEELSKVSAIISVDL